MAMSQPPTAERIEINVSIDGQQSAAVDATAQNRSEEADTPMDTVLQAVSDERRRRVVQELASAPDGRLSFGELIDRLARDEYGEGFTSDERKRIYVSIYQTHAPRLDELGLVTMDDESGTIEATDDLGAVAAWLDESARRFGGDA